MGLFVPNNPSFGYVTGNVITTRPAAAIGTTITPAQNAYGSYTQVLAAAAITRDCFGILINFNSNFVTAAARDTIVTIGIDPAGGTAWTDTINHLLASCASSYNVGHGGHWYYFPIFIPSGSSVAAKASVNNATVGTLRCCVWLYGAPKNISNLVYGQGVETLGATTASSSGTAVTSGTTSEGSWTSLGTTTKRWKFGQIGMGINDTTMTSGGLYHVDFASAEAYIGMDKQYLVPTSTEAFSSVLHSHTMCDVPVGSIIYGRVQCSGTADSSLSLIAYGVY